MSITNIRAAVIKALDGKASVGKVTMGYERQVNDGKKVDMQKVNIEFISPAGEPYPSHVLVPPGDDLGAAAVNLANFYIRYLEA